MIRQAIKIIWKKRGQNSFLLVELLLAFLVLFAVSTILYSEYKEYVIPIGFKSENVGASFVDLDQVRESLKFDHISKGGTTPSEFGELKTALSNNSQKEGFDTLAFEQIIKTLKREVLTIEGIDALAYTTNVLPFNNNNWTSGDVIEGENPDNLISYDRVHMVFSKLDYGKVLSMDMLEGSWYTKDDLQGKYKPVVVNEQFVKEYVKNGESAVGQKMKIWGDIAQITGVVKNFKIHGEFEKEVPLALPHFGGTDLINAFVFKFDEKVNPNWEMDLQNKLEQILKSASFFTFKLEDAKVKNSKQTWVTIIALSVLALFLVINVAMGIFGMLQYSIKKRQGEIGLRKALGANNSTILGQFLLEILILTTFAVVVGLFLAIQVPLLKLFEMDNSDFYIAMVISTLFIYGLVILSSLLPSIQASFIPPAKALRDNG